MRLKGYFTIEAAFIFAFVTLLVVGIVKLDFLIHDNLLSDVTKILGGIRYYQAAEFHYNPEKYKINITSLINAPVLLEDNDFNDEAKVVINQNIKTFYEERKIGIDSTMSDTEIDSIITANNNAEVIRAGGKLIQIIGDE